MNIPGPSNGYMADHAELLISSFHRLTGRHLVTASAADESLFEALYCAPFVVVSHNTDADPLFNYGNLAALNLFEMSCSEFTGLPSRQSAEPVNQSERQQLLLQTAEKGFMDNYAGVRISATGKRFRIEEATVWNLIDDQNIYRGQAAVFSRWSLI